MRKILVSDFLTYNNQEMRFSTSFVSSIYAAKIVNHGRNSILDEENEHIRAKRSVGREGIWAGKMLQSLENVKESWKLNFDLKKKTAGALGDEDTNFLTFSNDFMELERSTYFSVDYSATIPVDSWQVVGFEQKKNQTTGASDLTVSWNRDPNSHCEFALLRKIAKAKRIRFASLRRILQCVRFAFASQ